MRLSYTLLVYLGTVYCTLTKTSFLGFQAGPFSQPYLEVLGIELFHAKYLLCH